MNTTKQWRPTRTQQPNMQRRKDQEKMKGYVRYLKQKDRELKNLRKEFETLRQESNQQVEDISTKEKEIEELHRSAARQQKELLAVGRERDQLKRERDQARKEIKDLTAELKKKQKQFEVNLADANKTNDKLRHLSSALSHAIASPLRFMLDAPQASQQFPQHHQ